MTDTVDNIGTRLRQSAAQAFVLRITTLGLGLLTSLVLAQTLGVAGFGVYTYTVSWAILLSLVAKLGLTNYAIREVAESRSREDWSGLRGFLIGSTVLTLTASAAIALALVLYGYLAGDGWSVEQAQTLRLVALLLPALVLLDLLQSVLRGMKEVVQMHLPTIMRMGLLVVGAVALSLVKTGSVSAPTVVTLHIGTAVLGVAYGTAMVLRKMPATVRSAEPNYQPRLWLKTSLPMLLTAAMFNLVRRTDVLMIGVLDDVTNAGKYFVASRIAEFTLVSAAAVNALVAPTIAERYSAGDLAGLQRLLRHAAKLAAGLMAAIVAALILGSRFILRLYGEAFVDARSTLIVLMCAQIVSVAAGPVGLLMTMTGNERKAATAVGATAVLNIALNAVLIPEYGVEGAAAATTISTIIWNVILFVQAKRVLAVTPGIASLLTRSRASQP